MNPSSETEAHAITAAVLAGGLSRRMQCNKAWCEFMGRPLITGVIEAIKPQVSRTIVIARGDDVRWQQLGCDVISDPWPDSRGPLAGVLAALRHADTSWVLIVPCDAVGLPLDLAEVLIRAASAVQAPAAYAVAASGDQYTCCLARCELEASAAQALAAGRQALGRWLADVGAAAADFCGRDDIIWSINTPDELSAVRARYAAKTAALQSTVLP